MELNELKELINYYEKTLKDWEELYEKYLKETDDEHRGQRKIIFGKIHGLSAILNDLKRLVK